MKKNLLLLLGAMLSLLINYGCEKEHITPVKTSSSSVSATVSFNNDIVPLFKKCLICHSGTNDPNLATDPYTSLTKGNFINTNEPAKSILYIKLTDPNHPGKDLLTSAEQALILSWIQKGAHND
jgi:hypothetical protein